VPGGWSHSAIRPRHLAKEQVNQVHSAGTSGGSPGRRTLAVVLAIIGVLAIIAGILYVAGAANSLHFMVGSVHKGHHLVRAAVSFVVGVALLTGAWFAARAGLCNVYLHRPAGRGLPGGCGDGARAAGLSGPVASDPVVSRPASPLPARRCAAETPAPTGRS
jgi:hypothetical protein